MPDAARAVARQAPIGKPPPSPLASVMMSGVMPRPLVGEQPAGAAHAALHLVEDQQQVVLVAQPPQLLEERGLAPGGCRPRPGSARSGPPRCRSPIAASTAREVAERHLRRSRAAPGGSPRDTCPGRRPRWSPCVRPWKAPSKVMIAVALGLAALEVEAPRHLDRALERLGARVAEEHGVGEGLRDQPLGELLLRPRCRRGWSSARASRPAP